MPETLTPSDLAPEYVSTLTTQEYVKSPVIEGIRVLDLRLMTDDGGNFAELIRLNDQGRLLAFPEFQVRQSSYSLVLPGAIKAFHLHYNQEDVWFVPPSDRLLVGLIDCRKGSPTCRVSMRLVLGAGRAQLLYIPRGVAHGAANLGLTPATILYYVNQYFNLEDPDERRLPWDLLGKTFWQMTPG